MAFYTFFNVHRPSTIYHRSLTIDHIQRRLKLTVEYDGSDFHGWQYQPDTRTVQCELEAALEQVLNEQTSIIGAGRTDAGVHSIGQVAHLDTTNGLECERILLGVNSLLDGDVSVLSVEEVDGGFHARYSALSRRYRYRLIRLNHPLQRRYAWHPGCVWNDALIGEAVKFLPGRHSFRSFSQARPGESDYICNVIEARWEPNSDGATFEITADRFMHRMVRGLVGALIDLGRGYLTLDEFRRLLEEPTRNGDVRTAPARGLVLVEVRYGNKRI